MQHGTWRYISKEKARSGASGEWEMGESVFHNKPYSTTTWVLKVCALKFDKNKF